MTITKVKKVGVALLMMLVTVAGAYFLTTNYTERISCFC
ncbi:hypothetical protein QMA0248_1088 [Streptococcus iniae]|nr:hypothetical protein K710_1176 [Streptococcus iniae SF1]ASL34880.1 hypothetical protein QMA0248_1088 [Streptococcus iniae]